MTSPTAGSSATTEPTPTPEATPEAQAPPFELPEPEERARRSPTRGVALRSHGRDWLLASRPFAPELARVRDRLFDEATAERKVDPVLLYNAAGALLVENYDLTAREAGIVVGGADPKALVDAVADALLGPADLPASWSDWVLSALVANGIDPAAVPHALLPYVLRQLVATGRAVPADRFVHSLEHVRKKADFLKLRPGPRR